MFKAPAVLVVVVVEVMVVVRVVVVVVVVEGKLFLDYHLVSLIEE